VLDHSETDIEEVYVRRFIDSRTKIALTAEDMLNNIKELGIHRIARVIKFTVKFTRNQQEATGFDYRIIVLDECIEGGNPYFEQIVAWTESFANKIDIKPTFPQLFNECKGSFGGNSVSVVYFDHQQLDFDDSSAISLLLEISKLSRLRTVIVRSRQESGFKLKRTNISSKKTLEQLKSTGFSNSNIDIELKDTLETRQVTLEAQHEKGQPGIIKVYFNKKHNKDLNSKALSTLTMGVIRDRRSPHKYISEIAQKNEPDHSFDFQKKRSLNEIKSIAQNASLQSLNSPKLPKLTIK